MNRIAQPQPWLSSIENSLSAVGIVPVVTIGRAADAVALGAALAEGGLPIAEITFRTDAAADAIAALRVAQPDFLVGAGTISNLATLERALDAGAQFIVSPGFNPVVVERCLALGVPVVPGINNPSGIEIAQNYGLSLLKFFPAEASGGLAMLNAMSAPYAGVSFMPTGGINRNNLPQYLSHSAVAACGGTWIATEDAISAQRFDEITTLAREAVALAAPHTSWKETSRT